MNPTNANELRAAPYNPRTATEHDFKALQRSMRKFGDLSCVVYNETTNQLVGGHLRTKGITAIGNAPIEITERLEAPNSVGTIARGFIVLNDEKFPYRVVRWDESTEKAANVASNRIQGSFDDDMLANLVAEINQYDPDLADFMGFTNKELDKLLQLSSDSESDNDDDDRERITFSLPSEQVTVVMQALNEAKIHIGKPTEFSDEVNGEALLYIARNFLKNQSGSDDDGANFA